MATAKQIAANRKNATRSTGPRTQEGKVRSRMNALRHGLAATQSRSGIVWHEKPVPSLRDLNERLRQIEVERLKTFREIDKLLVGGPPDQLQKGLQQLTALNRYSKRAHAKLKRSLREQCE